jgi:hypothetical protein
MPGMDNIQSMLGKMGLNGLSGGGKMNTGAMEAQLNKRLHMAKMKERMKAKVEAKAQQQQAFAQAFSSTEPAKTTSDEELLKLFSLSEKAERTPRGAKPQNKKKGKK